MSFAVDVRSAVLALDRAKREYPKRADGAIGRGALEISRDARRSVRKATSQLTNAILARRVRLMEWLVIAATDYARPVEEGRRPGRRPPVTAVIDWLKVKRIQPRNPNTDQTTLAFLIARKIGRDGVPAAPYMKPAFDRFNNSDRLPALLRQAKVGRA